jgi:hypothetical protein
MELRQSPWRNTLFPETPILRAYRRENLGREGRCPWQARMGLRVRVETPEPPVWKEVIHEKLRFFVCARFQTPNRAFAFRGARHA